MQSTAARSHVAAARLRRSSARRTAGQPASRSAPAYAGCQDAAVLIDDDARAEVLDLCQSTDPGRHDQPARPRDGGGGGPAGPPGGGGGRAASWWRAIPDRANLVARHPGTGGGPSLAFVGHLDVVPADPRDWTHPPFAAVVDGELPLRPRRRGHEERAGGARGRDGPAGAVGLHPAGRPVAARGRRRGGRLADVGMRWLLEHRPDIGRTTR